MTARNPDLSDAKPRVIRFERKRQALLGNQRALKHGRTTAAAKAARLERQKVFMEEQRLAAIEWNRTVNKPIDYGPILDELDRLRREKEAQGDFRWSRRG